MDLLWSDNVYDNVCSECEHCSDEKYCAYYKDDGELNYDIIMDLIDEDLHEKFKENGYKYFVVGDSCNWYGGFKELEPNMNGFSMLYDSIDDILNMLSDGVGQYNLEILKGKYYSLYIRLSHHDGSELYQVCRLNSQGLKYYDRNYDFDFRKHMVKGVLKDFDFFV